MKRKSLNPLPYCLTAVLPNFSRLIRTDQIDIQGLLTRDRKKFIYNSKPVESNTVIRVFPMGHFNFITN